jgi:hypothetical protein
MQSVFNFLIKPKGEQYNNREEINGQEVIVNTSLEHAKDVNKNAIVVGLPMGYEGNVQIGDEVIVWHNVFRISYNDAGIPRQSNFYIQEDLFFAPLDTIYLIIRNGKKIAANDSVFVKPVIENDEFHREIEKKHVGILKYINPDIEKLGLKEGDKIAFRRNCEYEFFVEGERLYKMTTERILALLN